MIQQPREPDADAPVLDRLWAVMDRLRGPLDISETKWIVLGLICLRYLSEESRWSGPCGIQAQAQKPTIGRIIDEAMAAVEQEIPSLQGVLPKDYSRLPLGNVRLGELVELISTIGRSKDHLHQVYEWFLDKLAVAGGRRGDDFYTPQDVADLLVAMVKPCRGRVFDPCCGSGSMFVSCDRFLLTHGGRRDDLAFYGQEINGEAWRLAKMRLAVGGIGADLGPGPADSLLHDLHPDLKADFVLAVPPFNVSRQANTTWIQHVIDHLGPAGFAGFVMGNGSLFSSHEGASREQIIESDLVDCIVTLPGQLFYTTSIPVCLWLLARDKKHGRHRCRQTLFIDARSLGAMIDRVHRALTSEDIVRIAGTYHAWRSELETASYNDVAGFCKSVSLEDIRQNRHVLMSGQYVEAEDAEEGTEPAEDLNRLVAMLRQQTEKSATLEAEIWKLLAELGCDVSGASKH